MGTSKRTKNALNELKTLRINTLKHNLLKEQLILIIDHCNLFDEIKLCQVFNGSEIVYSL